MSHNEEHIFQLILEKLSGDISEEDNKYLERVASQDESVRRCLEELESARDVAGPDFMNDLHNERAWSNVLSLLHGDQEKQHTVIVSIDTQLPAREIPLNKLNKQNTNSRWWLAAAVIFIVASSIWMLSGLAPKGGATSPFADRYATGKAVFGDVQLLLDNGDTLSLTGNNGKVISVEKASLHPADGQLSFTPAKDASGWNTLFVPTGKDYKVKLADGSIVHLNAFSTLRFPFAFSGNKREVYLEGEAYFSVAPDANHPFIVHTPETAIRVLGTSFNVNAYYDTLVVTSLVEGSIMTSIKEEAGVILEPGQETVYHKGLGQKVNSFDEAVTLAWRKGEYAYYNKPLSSLSAVLFHWFGKELVFRDPQLANKMLTGVIERDRPVTEFLESLGPISGITYNITGDKIYLSPK
ncbi:FecR domain-containing protein [Chitinophaga tropicalis]|uniref:DUF4974 domain-containing protein n=1 Tax=Chitinophaga tropicalis TaxID=2683588 RepID=A0A7K1U3T3_9BACT|nr:FecR domain-containing protein [Chitinophaga tropicalis]MVT08990.1 DUF4974 domain-containing protein [Chitinophaga tropicalis]